MTSRRVGAAAAVIWLGVSMSACSALPSTAEKLTFDERARSYRVFVPATAKEHAAPLILVLHGGGGGAKRVERYAGFDAIARREGLIVAYPEAVENHWNDGRGHEEYTSHRENVNDVGFLAAVVARISEAHRVDSRRVYACGMSNGAMMTLRFATEHKGLAAIGTVGGSMAAPIYERGSTVEAVPVLMIHGTDDPLVPFDGGEVRFRRKRMGRVASIQDTIAFWVRADGCEPKATITHLADADPDDETRVRREVHAPAETGGAEVVLYAIEGGGHTWPKRNARTGLIMRKLVGRTSRDVAAADVLWGFFRRHVRSEAR